MNRRTLVILFIAALLLIIAGLAIGGEMGWSWSPLRGGYETLVTLDVSGLDAIRADMRGCDLRFYAAWDDSMEVDVSGRALRRVTAAVEGRTLVITESVPGRLERLFGRESYEDYAVVWLPESFAGRIEAVSDGGDITLSTIPRNGLTAALTTDSGELSVYSCRVTELSLTASEGDVSLYDDVIGDLTVTTDSGDVWLDDLCVKRAVVSSVSGTIYGSLEDSENADVTIVSASGEVYVDY